MSNSQPSKVAVTWAPTRQTGSSLVSVLVGIAIGGMVLSMLFQSINGAMQRLQVVVDAADLRDLRLHLAISTDCVQLRAALSTCPAGGYVPLKRANGDVLVQKYVSDPQATVFGKFRVRAECASKTTLVIRAAARKSGSYDWANADLFPTRPPGVKRKLFSCVF